VRPLATGGDILAHDGDDLRAVTGDDYHVLHADLGGAVNRARTGDQRTVIRE
jgi:hypothetical protein